MVTMSCQLHPHTKLRDEFVAFELVGASFVVVPVVCIDSGAAATAVNTSRWRQCWWPFSGLRRSIHTVLTRKQTSESSDLFDDGLVAKTDVWTSTL